MSILRDQTGFARRDAKEPCIRKKVRKSGTNRKSISLCRKTPLRTQKTEHLGERSGWDEYSVRQKNGGSAWESNPPTACFTYGPTVLKTAAATRRTGTSTWESSPSPTNPTIPTAKWRPHSYQKTRVRPSQADDVVPVSFE